MRVRAAALGYLCASRRRRLDPLHSRSRVRIRESCESFVSLTATQPHETSQQAARVKSRNISAASATRLHEMKRRSSQQVRRLVLDASAAAFRTKGLARVTTDEIAEAAGVSMSVIFRHFPSKGHLFREALVAPFVESMQVFTAAWKRSFAAPIDEDHIMS